MALIDYYRQASTVSVTTTYQWQSTASADDQCAFYIDRIPWKIHNASGVLENDVDAAFLILFTFIVLSCFHAQP
jgi:hypothetical protein